MTIEKLVEEGNIHPFDATQEEIARAMDIARRDLALAQSMLNESLDWSYSIAYNAVLQVCRAYMFHLGYRPAAAGAHKNTFAFMHEAMKGPFQKTVAYFDRVRKKRHQNVYEEIGLITEKEAKKLIEKAETFISYIERELAE